MKKLENLLKYIIPKLVITEDEVKIITDQKSDLVTFKVSVAKGELGMVIGKHGLRANSIRGVVQAAAAKEQLNVNVVFVD